MTAWLILLVALLPLTSATVLTKAKTLWGPQAIQRTERGATGAWSYALGCYQPAAPKVFVEAGRGASWDAAFAAVDLKLNGPVDLKAKPIVYRCMTAAAPTPPVVVPPVVVPPVTPKTVTHILAWDPPTASEAPDSKGYRVYRSLTRGQYATPLNAVLIAPTVFTYSDATAAAGVDYFYTVRAVRRDNSETDASNEIFTGKVVAPLVAPTNFMARCSAANTSAVLSWTAVDGATAYFLRVDHEVNNRDGLWVLDASDIYVDGLAAVTYTMPVVIGHSYKAWVHSANPSEGVDGASTIFFTCGGDE
jgi:hypothetical protein